MISGQKGVRNQPLPTLSWVQRVKIAISSAKGLEFLHLKADPSIIHTNIKSSNILIFDDDCAKIGDVGVFEQLTPYRDFHYYDRTRPPHNVFFHQAPEYATKCFYMLSCSYVRA
jgi:pto-interacting protein 1